MNTVVVNLDDYLSDEEKRQIARDAFREVCAAKSAKDFERILDNAAYALVRQEVDAVFDGGMAELVKAKAVEVIKKLSDFTVFKKPDAWDREASKAYVHLQAAMSEAGPAIRARVNHIIESMDSEKIEDMIRYELAGAIIDKLTAKPQAQP